MCRVNPSLRLSMVVFAGAPATIACKPRQVRKEATVVSDSGAGVLLAKTATLAWLGRTLKPYLSNPSSY